VNVEAPPQLLGGVTIEDAQDDTNAWMDRTRIESDFEGSPDRRSRATRLRMPDHWNMLLANRCKKLVVRVLFDDQHWIVLGTQSLHEVIADAAQPTHDHVADAGALSARTMSGVTISHGLITTRLG
jgi:hypothetical protein